MLKKLQQYFHFHYDGWIVAVVLSLLVFGLLMVASASMVISDRQFGYPFHYFIRQVIYIVFGVCAGLVVTRIPVRIWREYSGYCILICLGLLVLVLIPGIGRVVNGSRRWINFGIVTLQVSEIVKMCAVLYLASYLQRFQTQVQTEFVGFLKPLILLAMIGLLLLMQPDFGSAAVIAMTFLALLFVAGVRLWPLALLFVVIAGAMVLLAVLSPYRMQRITTFMNPWQTQYGAGYQLTQSLIAFGRGGFFGVGLGNSVQKLFYLPEAHTDFLFAVIAEELGLLGEVLLLALFVILVGRIFILGRRSELLGNLFAAYTCYGVGLWLGAQAMINIGVNAGVLPTKGLTLPFISYGGSSMLVNCAVIGIVLRIAFEQQWEMNETPRSMQHYHRGVERQPRPVQMRRQRRI